MTERRQRRGGDPASYRSYLQLVWVAAVVGLLGCGGATSNAAGGTDGAAGGGGSAGDAAVIDAGGDGDAWPPLDAHSDATLDAPIDAPPDAPLDGAPSIYPACEERGGSCVLLSGVNAACPAGTYSPFSFPDSECPTNAPRRCCVPTGGFGSTCTSNEPCDNGGCLDAASGYPPGGLCAQVCDPGQTQCPAWATCVPVFFSQAMGMCMLACDHDTMCREGWSCQAFSTQPFTPDAPTTYVCWGAGIGMSMGALGDACTADSACLSNTCRSDPGSGSMKCAATCDDAHPCLAGYSCRSSAGCSTPGCGYCFPG